MLPVSTSVVSTPAVVTDTHLSQAPCGIREHCGYLHQGHISSFSNPFASTGLSMGFVPPEPELESLTFACYFCSLTLGLKMPVPLSCGLHVINHPSLVFTPLPLQDPGRGSILVVACSHSLGSGGRVAIVLPLLIWPSSSLMCVRLPAVRAAWSAGYVAGSALAA